MYQDDLKSFRKFKFYNIMKKRIGVKRIFLFKKEKREKDFLLKKRERIILIISDNCF